MADFFIFSINVYNATTNTSITGYSVQITDITGENIKKYGKKREIMALNLSYII